MADRPSVTLKINAVGGAGAVDQLDDVAAAQDKVADATADAAKAAAAQGDAGAKAESKLKKLWEGLKAGAGAAAGAAAGLAGMAVTLKGELTPETQTAVAGLQGLSGVLAAFGPVGALASVAVSGVAAALAAFDETAIQTAGDVDNLLTKAIKQLNDNIQTTETRANKAVDAVKRVGIAKISDFAVLDAAEMAKTVRLTDELNRANQRAAEIGDLLTDVEQRRAALDARTGPGQTVDARQAVNDELRAELATQQDIIAARQLDIRLTREVAEARLAGNSATPRSTGPGAPRIDYEAEANAASRAAIEAAQAVRADRESDIYAQLSALDALKRDAVAAAAQVQAAWSAAWYGDQITQAITAGADAQQDAIRGIEASAAELMGIYDGLTTGVSDFGKAAGEGFAAAAVSAAIYGGSLKDAANQALQAATVTAATEALIATAKGLGYLAAGAFGYAPGLAAAKASFAAAATGGVIAGGAAAGAAATGGFGGGGGGVGSLGPDAGGPPTALDRPAPAEAPQDREFFINLNSGAGGSKPLSRGDAGAIAGALVDIFRPGGLRLEARRA